MAFVIDIAFLVKQTFFDDPPRDWRERKNMEAWILQGFLMFGPPVIGALVVRANPMQWQRWIIWVVACIFSYGVMHGAGWTPSSASLAIVIVSVLGGFSAEIIPAIAQNINGQSLRTLGLIAIIIAAYWFLTHATRAQLNDVASLIGFGIVAAIVVSRFTAK